MSREVPIMGRSELAQASLSGFWWRAIIPPSGRRCSYGLPLRPERSRRSGKSVSAEEPKIGRQLATFVAEARSIVGISHRSESRLGTTGMLSFPGRAPKWLPAAVTRRRKTPSAYPGCFVELMMAARRVDDAPETISESLGRRRSAKIDQPIEMRIRFDPCFGRYQRHLHFPRESRESMITAAGAKSFAPPRLGARTPPAAPRIGPTSTQQEPNGSSRRRPAADAWVSLPGMAWKDDPVHRRDRTPTRPPAGEISSPRRGRQGLCPPLPYLPRWCCRAARPPGARVTIPAAPRRQARRPRSTSRPGGVLTRKPSRVQPPTPSRSGRVLHFCLRNLRSHLISSCSPFGLRRCGPMEKRAAGGTRVGTPFRSPRALLASTRRSAVPRARAEKCLIGRSTEGSGLGNAGHPLTGHFPQPVRMLLPRPAPE